MSMGLADWAKGLGLLALAAASLGCVGRSSGLEPATAFPERAQLEELAERPVKKRAGQRIVRVKRWSPDDTVPGDAGAVAQAPWIRLLETAVAATDGRVQASQPLHCAAAQAGQFVLQHGGLPDQRLLQFMAARCGSTMPRPQATFSTNKVPGDVPDAEILSQWRSDLLRDLAARAKQERSGTRIGIWFGRKADQAFTVMTRAVAEAELGPIKVSDSGLVSLRGVVRTARRPEAIYALVNHGSYAVAMCEPDYRHKLPRFALRCPLAADDDAAWIEIIARPSDRLLSHRVARLLVSRADAPLEYHAGDTQSRPVKSPAEFRKAVISELNRVRRNAGLKPVRLATAQSAFNQKLVAPFFDAALEGDTTTADVIALGLLAGWEVGGPIRGGSISGDILGGSHDAGAWLAQCLDAPFGRSMFLAPETRQVALGALLDTPFPGLGVVTTTYSFFESTDYAQEEALLLDLVRRQRLARGKSAPTVLDNSTLTQQATLIRDQGKHPANALQDAMRAMSETLRTSVRGGFFTGNTLRFAQLPPELLTPSELGLAVAVTHVKVPGAAWAQYIALFVLSEPEQRTTTASRGGSQPSNN